MIEGIVHAMKQAALAITSNPLNGNVFSLSERMLLAEETYDLHDDGKVSCKRAKIPISKNIKFAFKAFSKANLINYELPVKDDTGWESFQKSLKVRDRLMHPKTIDDLAVSDDELKTALMTFDWFDKAQKDVLQESINFMSDYLK